MEDQQSYLREYLRANGPLWTRMASEAGVARRAIAYIANDERRDPQYSTIRALMRWIAENDPLAIIGETATATPEPEPATDPAGQPRRPTRATATSANGDGSGRVGQQAA